MRLDQSKRGNIIAFRDLQFHVQAVGDSYSDNARRERAIANALFDLPDNILADHPELPVVRSFGKAKTILWKWLAGS